MCAMRSAAYSLPPPNLNFASLGVPVTSMVRPISASASFMTSKVLSPMASRPHAVRPRRRQDPLVLLVDGVHLPRVLVLAPPVHDDLLQL
eukprot:5757066-Alexandrium_andersonii.AAC.1